MERYRKNTHKGKTIFAGVDLHLVSWHVTVRTEDQELFSGTLPGTWDAFERLLERYRKESIEVVYEAGCFGFWLHDQLVAYGIDCIVTPPGRERGLRGDGRERGRSCRNCLAI